MRLDDALLADTKAAAARSGRTLTAVIEDALRMAMASGGRTASPHGPVVLPTFAGRGPQPGVDLDSNVALLDLIEQH